MGFVPTAKLASDNAVTPFVNVSVPSKVVPLKNAIVPVGTPAPGATALTVALKMAGCPNTVGLMAETIAFVVAAWFTT